MRAVVLAGGEGTRLRPLTSNAPKPMLPIANRPMIEHVVDLLRRHGVEEIVITVSYMANVIDRQLGDGRELGVSIVYVQEPAPLGTAGSVRNAKDWLDDRFLVLSGDVVTDIDLTELVRLHDERSALATMALARVPNPREFGMVTLRGDGTVERFLEKPGRGQVFSDTVSTGIYVFDPAMLSQIPTGRLVDFSLDVFPGLLAGGRLHGAVVDGFWEDVGTLESYLRVHTAVLDRAVSLEIPGFEVAPGVWLGEGAEIDPAAVVDGPAVIGPGARIGPGCRLGPYSVLGANVGLLADVDVERSVLHDNVHVAPGARLRGAVVGRGAVLGGNVRVAESAVLGDGVRVGANAVLGEAVKVYPGKTVEDGAVVNSSIVWASRAPRSLFGPQGVSGIANIDVTPELAIDVAMAFGATLRKGSSVVASRDSSRSARMLKRAVMAGLNASGIDVVDLEVASLPVTRFLTRSPQTAGGVSVRLVPGDPRRVTLRFLDADGADLAEDRQRAVERHVQREDQRRALPEEVGDISFPARALESYAVALEATVDIAAIEARRFKLVVDYAYGTATQAMTNVLAKLGADVLALNPYQSTRQMLSFSFADAAGRVAGHVRSSGADLGAVIGPDGERLVLVDDRGSVLGDATALLTVVELAAAGGLGERIAVPVTASRHVETVAGAHGVEVVRTKLAGSALLAAGASPGVGFAGDGAGGFAVPRFLPAFDAAATLVTTLGLLAGRGEPLSAIRARLPRVHLARVEVPTPWDRTGAIMRAVLEDLAGQEIETTDGVKARYDDGWVLVVPDPAAPMLQVWAEGADDAAAEHLAGAQAARLQHLAG